MVWVRQRRFVLVAAWLAVARLILPAASWAQAPAASAVRQATGAPLAAAGAFIPGFEVVRRLVERVVRWQGGGHLLPFFGAASAGAALPAAPPPPPSGGGVGGSSGYVADPNG